MSVPMVDLKIQYEAIKNEINDVVLSVMQSTTFILGPQGKALEQSVAAYHGVQHAVGVGSGTDALHLALLAAGVKRGDEVITTPFTFIATAEAISYVGGIPVFVDIRPDTFNIDITKIEKKITKKTKAIIPVHLYGQPADMGPLMAIAGKHGLKVIEDCAQSFGAEYRGKKTGALGDLGCFSFFPSKNLGAYGDGGMVITDDAKMAGQLLSSETTEAKCATTTTRSASTPGWTRCRPRSSTSSSSGSMSTTRTGKRTLCCTINISRLPASRPPLRAGTARTCITSTPSGLKIATR